MAQKKPFHFADTGLPKLVDEMMKLGASRRRPTWRVKIAGGAATLTSSGSFDIGKRNQLAIKKVLWKLGMAPIAEHVGGTLARTLTMRAGSPDVEIYLGHKERIVI
jgi:chemotaxis protein CheD